MTGRRRLAVVALAACVLATATGCPAPETTPEQTPTSPTSRQALPARPTDASIGLDAYAGPPADAPPSAGPLTTVRAAVDLTPATPGVFARAESVVAAPGGGAYVLLRPIHPELAPRLVTVGPAGGGFAVTGSVPIAGIDAVWGMHLLPDGTVTIAGRLPRDDGAGYGFEVVDPTTGTLRTTVAVPHGDEPVSEYGTSALSADGATLYLFVGSEGPTDAAPERLVAVDVATGGVLADRDLTGDVAAASAYPVGRQLAGLVARPGGGATLVFDASPTDVAEERIPTLLTYDALLGPVGGPVRVTNLSEGAETQAVAGGADGTVFLVAELAEGAWLLAVPDGGGAGPVLVQLAEHIYDYALVVEPAQVWAVLPAAEGARAVDLTTGDVRGPVRLGCLPRLDVRDIVPAADGALVIGECDTPREDTQMLWLLGP